MGIRRQKETRKRTTEKDKRWGGNFGRQQKRLPKTDRGGEICVSPFTPREMKRIGGGNAPIKNIYQNFKRTDWHLNHKILFSNKLVLSVLMITSFFLFLALQGVRQKPNKLLSPRYVPGNNVLIFQKHRMSFTKVVFNILKLTDEIENDDGRIPLYEKIAVL